MLPMFGDYYTPNLLSGSPRTRMIGNQIDQLINQTTSQGRQGAALTVILMAAVGLLMLYYLSQRRPRTAEARDEPCRPSANPGATAASAAGHPGLRRLVVAPGAGRHPVLVQRRALPQRLAGLLDPLVSDRRRLGGSDESLRLALTQSLRLAVLDHAGRHAVGVALALGLARWRGRGARAANALMLVPLVTPEIVMGVALFLVFANLYDFVPFGTWAQLLGHVTFSISFVVIIVRGRLFAIGRDYEEAAMDLGASPSQALRRVLLPLLAPAIFSSFAIVFAISIDDFVISQFLVGGASSVTIPVRLYSGARLAPPPSLNALATLMLALTLIAVCRRTGDAPLQPPRGWRRWRRYGAGQIRALRPRRASRRRTRRETAAPRSRAISP